MISAVLLLMGASSSGFSGPPAGTDFGVRSAPGFAPKEVVAPSAGSFVPLGRATGNLSAAAAVGSRWGRVTSTYRTPAHNKRVGGVPGSFHTHGRAVDIARKPGVSHSQIAAAYRSAGFQLIESLDEGDHSHFAFSWGMTGPRPAMKTITATPIAKEASAETQWRIVSVPGARSR